MEFGMKIMVITTYLALCISAPWIARKWGGKGSWVWFFSAVGFLVSTLVFLGDV